MLSVIELDGYPIIQTKLDFFHYQSWRKGWFCYYWKSNNKQLLGLFENLVTPMTTICKSDLKIRRCIWCWTPKEAEMCVIQKTHSHCHELSIYVLSTAYICKMYLNRPTLIICNYWFGAFSWWDQNQRIFP